VTITVQGEPDTAPFTRIYQFHNKTDYMILSNSIKTIKNKLSRKMKININETLYIYLKYIMDELRLKKKKSEIIAHASRLLTPNQVMIGVPESLRRINFNIKVEGRQRLILTIKEPISTTSYILAS
jgi:urease gamma subunit